MSIFKKVKTDRKAEDAYEERVGGFTAYESDIYKATINRAYAVHSQTSDSIAIALEATLDIDGEEKPFTTEVWVTSREGNAYTTDPRTGQNKPVEGWMLINNLCLLATEGEADLSELETDNFSYKRKDKSIQTECYPELAGYVCQFAIKKELYWPGEKQADGSYVDNTEGKPLERNTLDKIFDEHGITNAEYVTAENNDQDAEPDLSVRWLDKHKGAVTGPRTRSGGGAASKSRSKAGAAGGSERRTSRLSSERPNRFAK